MLLIAFLLHHLYVGVTRPSRIFVERLHVPDYANSTCWEAMVPEGNSNSAGRQWCWEAMVLGGNGAGRQWCWEAMVLGGNGAGRQWCWEAMVLGGNGAGRQWCWEAIVLGSKNAGNILYYGHNYAHCARITISK